MLDLVPFDFSTLIVINYFIVIEPPRFFRDIECLCQTVFVELDSMASP